MIEEVGITKTVNDMRTLHGMDLSEEAEDMKRWEKITKKKLSLTLEQMKIFDNLCRDLERTIDDSLKVQEEAYRYVKMGVTSVSLGDMNDPVTDWRISNRKDSSEDDMSVSFGVGDNDTINEVTFATDASEFVLKGDNVHYTIAGSVLILRMDNTRLQIDNTSTSKIGLSKEDARRCWEFFVMCGFDMVTEKHED